MTCICLGGYLLVIRNKWLQLPNAWDHVFGPYYGVDRLPPIASPHHLFWRKTGRSLDTVARALSQYDDYFGDLPRNYLVTDRCVCETLIQQLDPTASLLELLFCEVLTSDESSVFPHVSQFPEFDINYGYDVSWATCNHSAIYQPTTEGDTESETYIATSPLTHWKRQVARSELNRYSLFDSVEKANSLKIASMAKCPVPAMIVFRVNSIRQ